MGKYTTLKKSHVFDRHMKYLDVVTGKTIVVHPWSKSIETRNIKNHPERYHKLFEE
jgi:hypothetical protein